MTCTFEAHSSPSEDERSSTSSVLKGDDPICGRTVRTFGTSTESSRFSFARRIECGMPLRSASTCIPPEKLGMYSEAWSSE